MLSICKERSSIMQMSYNHINIQYLDFIFNRKKFESHHSSHHEQSKDLILNHLRFSFDNHNILSFMVEDIEFLNAYKKEISEKSELSFAYYVLFDN